MLASYSGIESVIFLHFPSFVVGRKEEKLSIFPSLYYYYYYYYYVLLLPTLEGTNIWGNSNSISSISSAGLEERSDRYSKVNQV